MWSVSHPPAGSTPASQRAEEFLRRVLPEPEPTDDDQVAPHPAGVDERTQARLEAMGQPDRESW
jgi:hypothetical protein